MMKFKVGKLASLRKELESCDCWYCVWLGGLPILWKKKRRLRRLFGARQLWTSLNLMWMKMARGELIPIVIRGVICNASGENLFTFYSPIGIKEFNKAEELAIRKALHLFKVSLRILLWKEIFPMQLYGLQIKVMVLGGFSSLSMKLRISPVLYKCVSDKWLTGANKVAEVLAKQGIDRNG